MRSYRKLKRFLAGFLLFVFVGGLLTLLVPRQEIYPIYSWFLFALTPNAKTRYALQILEYQNQLLDPPLFYEEAGYLVPKPRSITLVKIAQFWGRAVEQGDETAENKNRALFESNFLPGASRYALMRVHYDPIARWKTGAVHMETVRLYRAEGARP
jgi:hypothetical protein